MNRFKADWPMILAVTVFILFSAFIARAIQQDEENQRAMFAKRLQMMPLMWAESERRAKREVQP